MSAVIEGDYTLKGFDLQTYYAGFCRRAMPEDAILRLSRASAMLPPEHVGYKVWMTKIAGKRPFYRDIQDWALGLGETIAEMKPRIRYRSRTFCPSYKPEWGHAASLDGVDMALGMSVTAASKRAEQYGCDWGAYVRIRNFVAGALQLSEQQYETELKVVFAQEFCS